MHMVAARLGCQSAMVGTGWANLCPGCMDRLGKHYSLALQGFISGREGCLGSELVFSVFKGKKHSHLLWAAFNADCGWGGRALSARCIRLRYLTCSRPDSQVLA